MKKLRTGVLLTVYCVALLLLFDFVYTKFILTIVPGPLTKDPVYNHGLKPNFSGQMRWGSNRYNMFTNSLGFRDASVREVPNQSDHRRVLVIGDSFTEGLGAPFEDTFVGMLYSAGQAAADKKTEFLNAGVVSYSPTVYYTKIKYLLERGLKFDEVIVASDISDVQDESSQYFCIDEIPEYRARCGEKRSALGPVVRAGLWDFDPRDSFAISDAVANTIKHYLYWYTGITTSRLRRNGRGGWTIPGFKVGDYSPLGVEGGIERSVRHMQALADLLASRGIPLTIVVYPWPVQLYLNDRDSRQAKIWRDFCVRNCKQFIDTFPAFFAYKDAHPNDWYGDLYIRGDEHFSKLGNQTLFDEISKRLPLR